MKRVMIIGCPGSGKTTLSHEIAKILRLPLYHLDLVMWQENWTAVPYQEFIAEQNKIIATESWVVDGNFTKSIPARIMASDTIVFLDVPRFICLYRLLKRYVKYFGKNRPDMGGGNKEAIKWAQFKFVMTYPRTKVYGFLKEVPSDKRLFILRSHQDTKNMLAEMRARVTKKSV